MLEVKNNDNALVYNVHIGNILLLILMFTYMLLIS